jgi:hypothetical protein
MAGGKVVRLQFSYPHEELINERCRFYLGREADLQEMRHWLRLIETPGKGLGAVNKQIMDKAAREATGVVQEQERRRQEEQAAREAVRVAQEQERRWQEVRQAAGEKTDQQKATQAQLSSVPPLILSALPIPKQGTIIVTPNLDGVQRVENHHILIMLAREPASENFLMFSIQRGKIIFTIRQRSQDIPLETTLIADGGIRQPIDDCPYWFSFNNHTGEFLYGQGEPRKECVLHLFDGIFTQERIRKEVTGNWVNDLKYYSISASFNTIVKILEHPVKHRPLLVDIPRGMDESERIRCITPHQLPREFMQLYERISEFVLDDGSFPFSEAIERSIGEPGGWCYERLREKARNSGSDLRDTYLRITLGTEDGDAPGHAYVMEIWPARHRSRIHGHAGAIAAIKVLHGSLNIELYRSLSTSEQIPFTTNTFIKDQITWMEPDINQTHRVLNQTNTVAVTIQCYNYPGADRRHHETFDYVTSDRIGHFRPKSDMDFDRFKAKMREDYHQSLLQHRVGARPPVPPMLPALAAISAAGPAGAVGGASSTSLDLAADKAGSARPPVPSMLPAFAAISAASLGLAGSVAPSASLTVGRIGAQQPAPKPFE